MSLQLLALRFVKTMGESEGNNGGTSASAKSNSRQVVPFSFRIFLGLVMFGHFLNCTKPDGLSWSRSAYPSSEGSQ